MKALSLAALIAGLAATGPATAADYHVIQRIKVPDGGFDYATFDAATGRVLMARTDSTTVIDAASGKVSELKSASGAHIALAVPGTDLLALTERAGQVRIVDAKTDMVLADLPAGKNPDGAAYDPFSKFVFAPNHDSGETTVVDPVARKVVATIPVCRG